MVTGIIKKPYHQMKFVLFAAEISSSYVEKELFISHDFTYMIAPSKDLDHKDWHINGKRN